MKTRLLGNGISVSEIGLGCMGMDHAYGDPADRQAMVDLIRQAVDLGCNFFDTAVVYGFGNEEVLGKAVKPIREKTILATKFGIVGQKVIDGKPVNILDSKPESIRTQVEGSLKRLNTDYIDLYYQHRVDPLVPAEEVAGTMSDLMREGKIRAWGLSNPSIDYIKKAHAVCPVAALENQYSMLWREPEKEVFDLCDTLNIAFVAYSPLGNGFLSGQYSAQTDFAKNDFRSFMGRFKPQTFERNRELLNFVKGKAQQKGIAPAQLVLAWELATRPFIIPIPGTTKLTRLKANLGASDVVLTESDMTEINSKLNQLTIDETYF